MSSVDSDEEIVLRKVMNNKSHNNEPEISNHTEDPLDRQNRIVDHGDIKDKTHRYSRHDIEYLGDINHFRNLKIDKAEDCKTLCGIPVNKKFRVFIYTFTYFSSGVAYALPAPFYPQMAEKKGMSIALTGFVFSVFELIVFITSPIFGYYLAAIGPKFAFTSGITVAGACSILFGTLDMCPPGDSFLVLSFLIRSVEAVGFSSFLTTLLAAASEEYPNNVATAVSFLEGAFGIGMMIGPTIGGVLYASGGFGLPFYFTGGLIIVQGILLYFLMPAPQTISRGKKSTPILKAIISPLVQVGMISTAIGCMGLGFLDPILAHHLEPFGLSVIEISLFFIIVPGAYTLSSPLLGYLSDNKGMYKKLIVIGQFVYGVGFLISGPSNLLPFIPYQMWTVVLGLVIAGLSGACTVTPSYKCILSGAIEVGFDTNMETYGFVSGIATSMYSLGAFLGPMLGGVLVQEFGDHIAFTVIGLLNIGVSVLALILFSVNRICKTGKQNIDECTSLVKEYKIMED